LMHMGNEIEELYIAYIALWIIIITALFSKSRRCRYLCPLWAFFGLIKKMSFFKLDKDKTSCIKCGLCNKSCPMNLNLKDYKEYNSSECISCLDCVESCPKNSLDATIFGKKIKKQNFTWMVVWIFFVVLSIIVLTPYRQTKPASNIVDEHWVISTDNLKWSNTLQYVIEKTNISFEAFQSKFGLPADIDKWIKLKEIGETYNIKNISWTILETEDIRLFIDGYLKK
jgi:ferredoxin